MGTFSYDIEDSLTYFVADTNNNVWQITMTSFDYTVGKFVFNKKRVSGVSVEDINSGFNEVKLYPNPATQNVTISIDSEQAQNNVELNIYSLTGQRVWSQRINIVDQVGNSDEWECQEMRAKIGGYTLPAEFNAKNIHKYGAVAMARRYDKNPSKRSSPFEFYIVLGRTYNKVEIRAHEREFGTSYTEKQKEIYGTIGGTPYLDQQHTVIGEVINGMDVAKELNKVKVDNREWPLTEIPITMKVIR